MSAEKPIFEKLNVINAIDEVLQVLPAESEIPQDYIKQNQNHWRKARRGLFSKPLELSQTGDFLHDKITKTFGLEDAQKPILIWSVVFDRPKTPSSKFIYEERYPEEINDEDKTNFSIGMARITEYATNYAAKDFFVKNVDIPILREFSKAYGRFADLATYEILINGTYRRMSIIESVANENGKSYKEALFTGLFKHDLEPINELVSDTKEFSGWSSINDIAIEIGKKRFKKPDIGKFFDKLEINKNDGRLKANLKNGTTSVLAGGVFRNSGVTEISGGIPAFILLETSVISIAHLGEHVIQNPNLLFTAGSIAAETVVLSLGPVVAITPFIGVHENLHSYSSDETHLGFIPANIIEKELTPSLARLEPRE